MSSMMGIASKPRCPIVLVQYKCDDLGVGVEEQFPWALIIITDIQSLAGPYFQIVRKIYRDERGQRWEPYYNSTMSLPSSSKCLGGVQVGTVVLSDVDNVVQVLMRHKPSLSSPNWNCRDYALELMEVLRGLGVMRADLAPSRKYRFSDFLPDLRTVSIKTDQMSRQHNRCIPYIHYRA